MIQSGQGLFLIALDFGVSTAISARFVVQPSSACFFLAHFRIVGVRLAMLADDTSCLGSSN